MDDTEPTTPPTEEPAPGDDKVKLTPELLAELMRARKPQVRYVEAKGECETCGSTLPFNPREGGIRRYCNRECKQRRHNMRGPRRVRRTAHAPSF